MQSEGTQCIITHPTAQLKLAGADEETDFSQPNETKTNAAYQTCSSACMIHLAG